jgi:hypothetical protein
VLSYKPAVGALLVCAMMAPPPTAHAGAQTLRQLARLRSIAVTPQEAARMRAYHERIAGVVTKLPANATLADLVRPVLTLAGERSTAGDAPLENRAALVTLAFYVNGWPLSTLVPEARTWPPAERRPLTLRGRFDLTQHFTVSAAIAASAGAPIADLIGIYKEVDDSKGGSGFSFSDLAADRAGSMLGQTATRSPDTARRLQARITAGLTEHDMMPAIAGLPDNLPESEFNRRFGGTNELEYHKLVADIDRRIAALALFGN